MLLYESLVRGLAEYPDRPAIFYKEQTVTYGELGTQVNHLAHALKKRGFGAGDRLAIVLPNHPAFTIAYYAITALGGVAVPVNPLLKPAELTYIWADSQVKGVVTIPQLVEGVREAQANLTGEPLLVAVCAPTDTPEGVTNFFVLLAEGSPENVDTSGVDDRAAAVCIYTSGTTGRPKGALLSQHNLTINCRQVLESVFFTKDDNFLTVLPLFHSFGGTVCQNTSLMAGASATFLDAFHPSRVQEAIETRKCTILPAVPTMFGALLKLPTDRPYDTSSVRLCVSGGAPMPAALMAAFEQKFNTIIIEGDGPTECGPVTSLNPPDGVRKPLSVGLPLKDVEVKIFNDNDQELGVDEIGEIVVRGENVMLGYHNQPEETATAMSSGWYHTGDLGKIDSDGYIYIVDRKKDMLLVGGLNVYPREVEEVLYAHPSVQDAAVIGSPDPLKGDEVVAVVALRAGMDATDRELIAYCRERLANYKVPRKVLFREALPLGGTGKVLKRLLRKELDME